VLQWAVRHLLLPPCKVSEHLRRLWGVQVRHGDQNVGELQAEASGKETTDACPPRTSRCRQRPRPSMNITPPEIYGDRAGRCWSTVPAFHLPSPRSSASWAECRCRPPCRSSPPQNARGDHQPLRSCLLWSWRGWCHQPTPRPPHKVGVPSFAAGVAPHQEPWGRERNELSRKSLLPRLTAACTLSLP